MSTEKAVASVCVKMRKLHSGLWKRNFFNASSRKRSLENTSSYFAPFPLYSPMLSRLLWVFSPNEFCISKLIFCQNHFRLMTVVFVYPLSTLPGYVHYFPPLPLNSCQQVYRAAPLFCINCRQPQEAMQRVHKGVRWSWRQGKHKCWLL